MLLHQECFSDAYYHFENAHVLGQTHTYRHTLSHYWMLKFGLRTKNVKEVLGQCVRMIASILFSKIWVPKGNTGGTNVSPLKPMPLRDELKIYFK